MRAKMVHRGLAIVLGTFIISHLGVHLFALAGREAHMAALDAIQWIYRNPVGESVLVLAILTQIFTGARRLRFKGIQGWARAQVISGIYLMIFLILHASAALYTHHIFGLETDFYWAAGTMYYPVLRIGFGLYYFAAIMAVFTHLAAALHFGWPGISRWWVRSLPMIGASIAVLILTAFAGVFYTIELTDGAAAYYQKNFGSLAPR